MHEARIRARARELPRAFLDELKRSGGDDRGAQAAVAGIVVLRVVDRWVAEGCPAGFDVAGATEAVSAVDAGQPVKVMLEQVLAAVAAGGPDAAAAATDRLLQYGRALEMDAKWDLALAVYDAVVGHAGVGSSEEAVIVAYLRQGYCLRSLGDFTESRVRYGNAHRLSKQARYLAGELRADLGRAQNDAAQGEPKAADAVFRRIVRRAEQAGLTTIRSMALHERAVIAGNGGDPMTAARFLYAALKLCDPSPERDRILEDIGESLRRLGLRDAARDAFLLLSCTARDQFSRWMALIHLMRIAGDDGIIGVYRDYRRVLDAEPLPVRLKIELEIQSGYALRALGAPGPSRKAFGRAITLARTHGHNRELREAEQALDGVSDCVELSAADVAQLSEIAAVLRTMRESAVAN